MKASLNIDWPIISGNEAQDERADGVFILDGDHEGKTTAEDMGEYWYIREWEPMTHNEVLYWFDRSGYSIYKDTVKKLYAIDGLNPE